MRQFIGKSPVNSGLGLPASRCGLVILTSRLVIVKWQSNKQPGGNRRRAWLSETVWHHPATGSG